MATMMDPPETDPRFAPDRPMPRVSLGLAFRRHWVRALLPVVVLVAAAIAAGYARSPQYTSEARLGVGRVDASTPASLVGFQAVTQSLAATYSRSVQSDDVVNAVAAQLKVKPGYVRSHLSATPIPQSPVFRVIATASSAKRAEDLSNAVSDTFVQQTAATGENGPDSDQLLDDYRSAVRYVTRLRVKAKVLQDRLTRNPVPHNADRYAKERSKVIAASIRADALQNAYRNSLQTAGSSATVQIIQHARSAPNDRRRVLELLLFIAVVAGLAIGLALALLASSREMRRAFAAGL